VYDTPLRNRVHAINQHDLKRLYLMWNTGWTYVNEILIINNSIMGTDVVDNEIQQRDNRAPF